MDIKDSFYRLLNIIRYRTENTSFRKTHKFLSRKKKKKFIRINKNHFSGTNSAPEDLLSCMINSDRMDVTLNRDNTCYVFASVACIIQLEKITKKLQLLKFIKRNKTYGDIIC